MVAVVADVGMVSVGKGVKHLPNRRFSQPFFPLCRKRNKDLLSQIKSKNKSCWSLRPCRVHDYGPTAWRAEFRAGGGERVHVASPALCPNQPGVRRLSIRSELEPGSVTRGDIDALVPDRCFRNKSNLQSE